MKKEWKKTKSKRRMFVDCPFSSLQIPVRIPPTSPQVLSRKEFDDNWDEFSSASVVVHWTSSTGYLPRLFFKHTFLHLIFQFVSQDSVQELPILNQISPYQGVWWFEFHVLCLWFRFDIQSLFFVYRVDLSFSCLFLTVFLIIFRGHTLFVFMCMSFA